MLRDTTFSKTITWILLVSLCVAFASGIRIHAHSVEHSHPSLFQQESIASLNDDHFHSFSSHLSIDVSHSLVGHDLFTEDAASSNGLIQKLSASLVLLFLVSVWLFQFGHIDRFLKIPPNTLLPLARLRYFILPPLRAPPR
ncbi:MAG: hypothetical protein ACI8P9_003219 [Parasphingorhabdus sp.]|jgi:hypothetical protein